MIEFPPAFIFLLAAFIAPLLKGSVRQVVLLVSSLLNAAYFLPIVYRAFFVEPPEGAATGIKEAPLFCLVPICLTAFGSLVLFFYHDTFLKLARLALGLGG